MDARRASGARPGDDPKTADEQYVLWVFPKATETRALRFTHEAGPVDSRFAGWLGGVYVLAQRLANVAPAATAVTDANGESAARINDEGNNGMWGAWENGPEGGPQPVSPQHPVDVLLVWRQPVAIRALGALWAGFAAAEVQSFRRPRRPPAARGRRDRLADRCTLGRPREPVSPRAGRQLAGPGTNPDHAGYPAADYAGHQGKPPAPRGKDQGRATRLARRVACPAPAGRCAAGGFLSTAAAARRTPRADPRAIHARLRRAM